MQGLFLILLFFTLVYANNKLPDAIGDWNIVGSITPRYSNEINGSNWSVGAETMDRNYTEYSKWHSFLSPLGVKHARVQGGWGRCEQTIGVYSWEWLDAIIFDMINLSVKPWLQTSYGNEIYKGGGTIEASSPVPTDEAVVPWNNWVSALVSRYGEYVDEWEIWNEPDLGIAVEDYAELLIRTSSIIKKIQPSAKIFAQLAGKVSYLQDYLAIVSEQGQLELIDTVTYHPYAYNPDSTYSGQFLSTLSIIRNFSSSISLYQGENGVADSEGGYGALSNYNWTETTQTKWALRRMLGDFVHGLRSSYFSIADMCYSGTINKKGLLSVNCSNLEVTGVKDAYHSVQYLTSIFDDTISNISTISYKVPSDDYSVYAFRNSTSNTDIVAVWNKTTTPLDENLFVNITISISGVNINNPVWVDLRLGWIFEIPNSNWNKVGDTIVFSNVPVYDSIVLLADLNALSKWSSD